MYVCHRCRLLALAVCAVQVEKDVERLSESFQQLQAAVKRFAQAGNAVKTLGEKKEGAFASIAGVSFVYLFS